jgi:hypothetical protein
LSSTDSGECSADGSSNIRTAAIKNYWSTAGRVYFRHRENRKAREKICLVVRARAIGIRGYVKIKAAVNPFSSYAEYFRITRHQKESKLLPAMSARE